LKHALLLFLLLSLPFDIDSVLILPSHGYVSPVTQSVAEVQSSGWQRCGGKRLEKNAVYLAVFFLTENHQDADWAWKTATRRPDG
jgi:hypothetical protein